MVERGTRALGGLCFVIMMMTACSSSSTGWRNCAEDTYLKPDAECLTMAVPIDHEQLDGRTIELSLFRLLGSAEDKEGQIWFLEGGPGASGRLMYRTMIQMAKYYPDFDYYTLDHRGVGDSTRFGCPGDNDFGDDMDAYRDCLDELIQDWGDDIRQFSTTNAAHDLHRAITAVRQPGKKVFIFGNSYGTYWLLRYLQLYPHEVDGVIVDSICTPGHCYLDNYDQWNNTVGGQFMDLCGADPVCSAKMATIAADPNQALETVFAKVDNGTLPADCNSYFTRESLRHTLAPMLNSWETRILIPPLIYRLNRCSTDDQALLDHFLAPTESAVDRTLVNSPMLCDLVSMSELYGGNTSTDLQQFVDGAHFCEDVSLRFARLYETGIWPLYSDQTYAQQLPQTDIPMLMLNGTTDPQTPLELAGQIEPYFTAAGQQFITVPFSTHGVIVNSTITPPSWPMGGEDPTCGSMLIGQFVHDPLGTLDTSCVGTVYPVDFDPTTTNNISISQRNFKTSDMWEGALEP